MFYLKPHPFVHHQLYQYRYWYDITVLLLFMLVLCHYRDNTVLNYQFWRQYLRILWVKKPGFLDVGWGHFWLNMSIVWYFGNDSQVLSGKHQSHKCHHVQKTVGCQALTQLTQVTENHNYLLPLDPRFSTSSLFHL